MDLPPSIPGVDLPEALRRFGGSWPTVQTFLKRFLSLHEGIEQQAEDYYMRSDFVALLELAHKIKGAAANISAVDVRDSALFLEVASREADIASMETGLQKIKSSLEMLRREVSTW
jgi:two-component system sensor histidine kinase/response regulator